MRKRTIIPIVVLAVVTVGLAMMPTEKGVANDADLKSLRAKVVEVDDSRVEMTGLLEYGTEHLVVEMLEGPARGKCFNADNELRAQAELDKKFHIGDTVVVSWPKMGAANGEILVAREHWRIEKVAIVFGAFSLLLIVFGGFVGAKALFSFVFSCVAIWKLLVPLCLKGYNPLWLSFLTVSVLTAVIMYLVAGATRKGLAAFLGAMLGVLASLVLAVACSAWIKVNGATMPYAMALRYAGYESLDIASLFNGAVILACSGAVMDLAMDIATGIAEVVRHNSTLPRIEILKSGFRMGRNVVGTMTTTLLLAYSGGYLSLLMLFAAQGTSPVDIINSTIVSAELVKTLVGSFGLVLVAPFTALVGAMLYGRRQHA